MHSTTQAQKVTGLRRSYIRICSFRVVFRGVEPRCYIGICDAGCLSRSPLLPEVSCEMLVLEVLILTFAENLVAKGCFGSLHFHFWWKSRGKCSFWKFGFSLLVKASWKIFVLEAWKFGVSVLVKVWRKNDRFGSLHFHFWWKSRGKCSFWKSGFSLLVKVSWKMLALKDCPARLSNKERQAKSIKQERPARVKSKSAQPGCLAKNAQQECLAKSVKQERQKNWPAKGVKKECPTRASSESVVRGSSAKSVKQEHPARVPSTGVNKVPC